jgi:molybdopterin-guanine dinucleotide biosynthesis protein A
MSKHTFTMENLIGVILCGGESKRMGADKGLLPIRNTIWAKFMHEKLAPFHIPVIYSINPTQVKDYSEHISPECLVVDNTEMKGPLNGLLSIQQKFPKTDVLLMACDMLDIDTATIDHVLQEYKKDSTFDFYVYQDEEYAQPFCGIYTGVGLEKVDGRIMIGRLEPYSMQSILDEGYTKRLKITHKNVFRNYNDASELEGMIATAFSLQGSPKF